MKELLQQLKEADRVCQAANEHYVKADQIEGQIEEINGKIKKAKTKWIVIGIVAGLVWYEIAGLPVSLFHNVPVLGAIMTIVSLVLIIGGIVLVARYCKGSYGKEKDARNAEIADIQGQAQAERSKGQQIFEDNVEVMQSLPSDYWYPLATGYLIKAVQTGRASTLAEALDKFEEQLHRWKLEEANSQMVAMQQQQTAYLSSIKTSSKVSAAANVANAFINLSSKM